MMEAVRVIKSLGLRPRRTIRVALWGARRAGPARIARVRRRSTTGARGRRDQARARQVRGVLQPRQRHRQDSRHLGTGQSRRHGALQAVDRAGARISASRSSARDRWSDRSRVVRRRRPSRASSSFRSGSSTTRARTTRTWISSIACSARTSCSRRRCGGLRVVHGQLAREAAAQGRCGAKQGRSKLRRSPMSSPSLSRAPSPSSPFNERVGRGACVVVATEVSITRKGPPHRGLFCWWLAMRTKGPRYRSRAL